MSYRLLFIFSSAYGFWLYLTCYLFTHYMYLTYHDFCLYLIIYQLTYSWLITFYELHSYYLFLVLCGIIEYSSYGKENSYCSVLHYHYYGNNFKNRIFFRIIHLPTKMYKQSNHLFIKSPLSFEIPSMLGIVKTKKFMSYL